MKLHTITSLYSSMQVDFQSCHSDLERSMVKAISGKEIRELAYASPRLTEQEKRIAREFGYR